MFQSRGRLSLYIQMSSVYGAKLGPVGGIGGQKQKPSFFFFFKAQSQDARPLAPAACISKTAKAVRELPGRHLPWPEDTYACRKTRTPEDTERGHPGTTQHSRQTGTLPVYRGL
ncbi:putative uncharacterized protein encoded by LINC00615 [Symphalangus syndactylus]|uniref:putative uncharacterized protein encoded by LINC00615 n=1 Tax=Symphalangus syndactylus TaxID=9590 RepID=UPI0024434678|nr:putative uncharacterized protein encoded by LINC00615 [Symphalangus syndactylus]